MWNKRTAAVIAAGALTVGAGLGVAGLASAEPSASPSATPSASSSTQPGAPGDRGERGGPGGGRHGGGHGVRMDSAALAEKLGVTEAKLTEALTAIHEAKKAADKPAAGEKPDPAAHRAELAKALAEKLGIDEAKVTTALTELDEARTAERTAAFKTKLDAAVKAGTLTQAEADAVLKAAKAGVIPAGGHGPR